MRLLFALCLALVACYADPTTLPDAAAPDAGPCGGACGPGTVCSGGACVAVDAGAVDAPVVDVGEDRLVPVDLGAVDVGSDAGEDVPADVGVDAGPVDVLPAGCVSTTVGNCCGVACPTPAHGTPLCGGGRCGVASCEANYGDCDGMAANGCETDLRATAAHCGACGASCAAGRTCMAGACVDCPSGMDRCNGVCVHLSESTAHCGACGRACSVGVNASSVQCRSGSCVLTCATGYANCDGMAANGCEVTLASDSRNCGACGTACPGGFRCCSRPGIGTRCQQTCI